MSARPVAENMNPANARGRIANANAAGRRGQVLAQLTASPNIPAVRLVVIPTIQTGAMCIVPAMATAVLTEP